MKAQQKQEKSGLKSLAKDKNSLKSLVLMETVKLGDNDAIKKIKRNYCVLLLKHYYIIDGVDSKNKTSALRSRCMENNNTGAARATLSNDRRNADRYIVLSSSDEDDD